MLLFGFIRPSIKGSKHIVALSTHYPSLGPYLKVDEEPHLLVGLEEDI